MSKDTNNTILDRIAEENISPIPRWKLVMKNILMWVFGILALFVGSLAFAVILYMVSENEWGLYSENKSNPASFILTTLPYFWILLVIIFTLAARLYIRHTKKGYKFSVPLVAGGSIGASILLGSVFYFTGLGNIIDKTFEEQVPLYARYLSPHHRPWLHPEEGLLAGKIIEIEENEIIIIDIDDEEWDVVLVEDAEDDYEELELYMFIRMIGETVDDHVFEAEHILLKPRDKRHPRWFIPAPPPPPLPQ